MAWLSGSPYNEDIQNQVAFVFSIVVGTILELEEPR